MFLSVIVPGLGVKPVSGGKKKGLPRTISTYGLIAAGVGCKLLSNSQYEKYHYETQQSAMDKYYSRANFSNKGFVILVGAGAVIWLYDIIWVANKGLKNRNVSKDFSDKFSFNYDIQTNNIYLGCTIKF